MNIEKFGKILSNLHDKTEYVIQIRSLKQALNNGLVLKKVCQVIKFKKHISKKKAKNDFEKDFFKLMNNAVFAKGMENVKKHRDIKLVTTERRTNYLESEPNFNTTKFFPENLLAIEMKKTEILMNKPVYLELSILEFQY